MPSSTKRRKPTNSMRNTLQRERSSRRVITAANQASIQREQVKTAQIVARESAHTEQRVATQQATTGARRQEQFQHAAIGKVAETATPSSDSNLIMVTIFTMGGLIIVYLLVTSSQNVAGFLGGLQVWLHALSSNTPLFKTKT